MTDHKVAVIGLGSIGLRHARNLLELGWWVHGFDPDSSARDALVEAGGQTFDSRDAALAASTMAVICSPNALHLTDAMAAISADCHVLVEKPLAHTEDGVEELIMAAEVNNLTLALAHNLRFHPAATRARALISRGKLGDLLWGRFLCSAYLPDWRPGQDYRRNYTADATTGGVLFDIIHEFDLAHYLMGVGKTIAAGAINTGTLDIAAEDCADVIIRHDNGAQSSLHLDYMSRPRRRTAEVIGTKGLLQLDIIERRLILKDISGVIVEEQVFDGANADTYREELVDFIAASNEGISPRCNGTDGLAVLRQVLAARKLSGLPQS